MPTRATIPKVRPAAVAGQFYPGNAARLRQDVAGLIGKGAPAAHAPKALIAPHAGYSYSGAIAAQAFAMLAPGAAAIRRVVVIGPVHYVPLRGIAVPTMAAFETPLGRIPIDEDALSHIAGLAFVTRTDRPHAPEHAIEVKLPFLQHMLPAFDLVPLVVGDAHPDEVGEVLGRLWGGPETLVVVSSDLSHYHPYETAHRLDAATAAAIESGDSGRLSPDNACGFLPIAGLLQQAAAHGLEAQRLGLCNSGDTAGSRDRVVGYGAWAFTPAADA
jgi:AmmeMemoRadiSam system protein B